jgi:hypothetical protein
MSKNRGKYTFWCTAQKFYTDAESLTASEIKRIANCAPNYPLVWDRSVTTSEPPARIWLSDGEVVSMEGEPHFYAAIPATMYRGISG